MRVVLERDSEVSEVKFAEVSLDIMLQVRKLAELEY
jgi:hypothetical protein